MQAGFVAGLREEGAGDGQDSQWSTSLYAVGLAAAEKGCSSAFSRDEGAACL
ncbi:MAG: hypothetical protein GX878_04495 [Firmicutes bacterium]|nr:hypothetical protein [Bacillota bacterium]